MQPPQQPAPIHTDGDGADSAGSLAHLYDAQGRPLEPAAIDEPAAPTRADRWTVHSLGPALEPPAPRPRRVGKRDIRMRNARLDNALRALAEIGRFNLVMHESHSEPVTLELRKVEPYDALLALAEARGMSIRYRRDIVIVSR
jgi:hypothetical protein